MSNLRILDEDGAPTQPPRELFAAAAERAGLIRPGDLLDQNLVDYALEIVTLAARVADRYTNPTYIEDTVGDAIRGHLYECNPAARAGPTNLASFACHPNHLINLRRGREL